MCSILLVSVKIICSLVCMYVFYLLASRNLQAQHIYSHMYAVLCAPVLCKSGMDHALGHTNFLHPASSPLRGVIKKTRNSSGVHSTSLAEDS